MPNVNITRPSSMRHSEAQSVVGPLLTFSGRAGMTIDSQTRFGLSELLAKHEAKLISDWVNEQSSQQSHRGVTPRESELRKECAEFVGLLKNALGNGTGTDIEAAGWNDVRALLQDLSRSRSVQGYSPSETASFIFSLKKPLFNHLRRELNGDGQALTDETWAINELLDKLGLYTTEVHQKAREEVIGASSTKCSSCQRPSCSSGTGSWRCR